MLRSIDWWTILLYIALLSFGWISVCGASYSYGETDIFSLSTRSGMQIVWIGTSIVLGFFIIMLDDRFYDTFAFIIYGLLVLLLFGTIFNPHSIKGETLCRHFGHYLGAYGVYCAAKGDGFCLGLSVLLPHVLS